MIWGEPDVAAACLVYKLLFGSRIGSLFLSHLSSIRVHSCRNLLMMRIVAKIRKSMWQWFCANVFNVANRNISRTLM